ncbi:hypothetical protein [Sulfurimonas sp.]|uniref:hypothetical protein n=1 Tax=Sulfurimonas sp. TaxID=2022749 RepID=UPI002B495B9E|nr:hypothetical protein [Sulfurimonas sp.]
MGEHQSFNEVIVFALPIPNVPEYNYSFLVSINMHEYSTVKKDNVPFHLSSDNFTVSVKKDGSVSADSKEHIMTFDLSNRVLYFKTNKDVSGIKSISWFISISNFNAVFLDDFDKTLKFY